MKAIMLSIVLLFSGAVAAGAAPAIKTDPVPGVEWFEIEIDGELFCCMPASEGEILLADFGFLSPGQHEVSVSACNRDAYNDDQCGSPVHFFLDAWPENKNWTYWRIMPENGYEQYFVNPLGAHVNVKTGKVRLEDNDLNLWQVWGKSKDGVQRRIHMGLHKVSRKRTTPGDKMDKFRRRR